MADLVSIFGGPFVPPEKRVDPPETQLLDAMQGAGFHPPKDIRLDGKLHRFSASGKKGDDAGWYVAFGDGVPAGQFGNWRTGETIGWRADVGRELTPAEHMALSRRTQEARKLREADVIARRTIAAETVSSIWEDGTAASADHPYLVAKGVQPHGCRVTGDGRLMMPMRDAAGVIKSLQYIGIDGQKRFHTGGQAGGMFWMLGTGEGVIYLAEGFATAATIHEVTGKRVAICYSAGNLPAVAKALAGNELIVVADNDESGAGVKYANECGCRVVVVPVRGDANDFVQGGGDLKALLEPPKTDWLIGADDFASQPSAIKWLVKNWLQQNSLIMVHGPSGGGKTFVVLDWCLHLAAGLPDWRGCAVKAHPVVYLAGEGHHGLKGRVAVWKQHYGIVDGLNMWVSKSGCDLNTPLGYTQARDAIMQLPVKPGLIVVDTLHRFLSGDENSAVDAKTMLDACAGLMAEFGCTVLLVHHTGVSDEAQHRARGSSAWRGALDIEISIIPPKGDGPLTIANRKAKDSEAPEPLYSDLVSTVIDGWLDDDGEPVTSVIVTPSNAPQAEKKASPHVKTFKGAWAGTGYETRQGAPYVSRSGLLTFLIEAMGMSEVSAKQAVKPGETSRLVGYLLNAGEIEPCEHGWAVKNDILAGIMEMEAKSMRGQEGTK